MFKKRYIVYTVKCINVWILGNYMSAVNRLYLLNGEWGYNIMYIMIKVKFNVCLENMLIIALLIQLFIIYKS